MIDAGKVNTLEGWRDVKVELCVLANGPERRTYWNNGPPKSKGAPINASRMSVSPAEGNVVVGPQPHLLTLAAEAPAGRAARRPAGVAPHRQRRRFRLRLGGRTHLPLDLLTLAFRTGRLAPGAEDQTAAVLVHVFTRPSALAPADP